MTLYFPLTHTTDNCCRGGGPLHNNIHILDTLCYQLSSQGKPMAAIFSISPLILLTCNSVSVWHNSSTLLASLHDWHKCQICLQEIWYTVGTIARRKCSWMLILFKIWGWIGLPAEVMLLARAGLLMSSYKSPLKKWEGLLGRSDQELMDNTEHTLLLSFFC